MKKFLTAFLCGAAVLLSAETLKEWKFEGDKVSGLSYPSEKIGFRISPDVKTPEGEPCGEFTVKSAGGCQSPVEHADKFLFQTENCRRSKVSLHISDPQRPRCENFGKLSVGGTPVDDGREIVPRCSAQHRLADGLNGIYLPAGS